MNNYYFTDYRDSIRCPFCGTHVQKSEELEATGLLTIITYEKCRYCLIEWTLQDETNILRPYDRDMNEWLREEGYLWEDK